jgi:hypothetical protein
MSIFVCGLESCTHTHTKYDIGPRCTKVKQKSNHGTIYLLINRCVAQIKIQMTISAHGSLDRFCLVHIKLFKYVMCVLGLANEGPFLDLLDLKSEKECENPHHGHFKPISHDLAKLITKRFVSRTKDNIINVYLVYKQISTNFSCEESRIRLTNPNTILNKKIPKTFISCSWCLLKPIKRLMEFINMVRILFTFEVGWLLHIHLFFYWTIQEVTLDVHLIKLKTMVSSIGK